MRSRSHSSTTASLLSTMVRFTPRGLADVRCSWILGQEQGYAGGPDPANREACANSTGLGHPSIPVINFPLRLWLSSYAQDKDLVRHIKTLNGARKAATAANSKFLSTPVCPNRSLNLRGANGG